MKHVCHSVTRNKFTVVGRTLNMHTIRPEEEPRRIGPIERVAQRLSKLTKIFK